ncbi:MAG: hypothetical protein IPN29_12415 [Saprospiraceae bacterium]|nr:hypothetical protein [Saprospiraceae bacterium]
MCIVSNKIKFCTCAKDPDELTNSWVLHRYVGDKNISVMGMMIDPSDMIDENFKPNEEILLARLQEKDAFDFIPKFKENDRMEISMRYPKGNIKEVYFTFSYQQGNWQPEELNPFELTEHYDVVKRGELINIFAQE